MKSLRIHTTLTLFACLVGTAPLGCSSSNDSSTGCGALSACCATLGGEEQSACNAVANAADVTDADCTEELTVLSSGGLCTSIAQDVNSNGGGASSGPATDGSFAGPNSGPTTCPSGGLTVDACGSLKSCCSELDVSQDPDTCITVAGEGTDEACAASLSTYQSSGSCADITLGCAEDSIGIVCHAVTSSNGTETCLSTSLPSSTCPAPYTAGSCSNDGLAGCCIVMTATSSGSKVESAACIYDASQASDFESACATENGQWTTVAP